MARKKKPEFVANGKAIAYLRVSKTSQAVSGLGLMAQGSNCIRKATELGLTLRDDVHFDTLDEPRMGVFVDDGTSAFKVRFDKRPAGERVMDWLTAGDTLIVSRLDRAFRNVADFIDISGRLIANQQRLVVCSPPIDLGTATGRMLARHLANLAEWESDRKGERIRDGLAQKKLRGSSEKPSSIPVTESLPSSYRYPEKPQQAPTDGLKPGRVMLYVRVSHRDSVESGLGILVQLDIARRYAKNLIEANPLLTLHEVYTDPAVSAHKHDLRTRPAGSAMDTELREGDQVVFSTLDRGFRSIADMADTILTWQQRGIGINFAAESLSMDDPAGRMMANIIVVFAQMEAEIAKDRSAEARQQLAAQGKFQGGRTPPFWDVFTFQGKRKLALSRKKIVAFRLIRWLKHCGMSIQDSLVRCEELHAKREKRPALPLHGVDPHTPMSKQLPENYERDRNHRAFPLFTRGRYDKANPLFDQALSDWRKVAAQKRVLRG